jgi:DNA-binding MarR family transcriptional regulator
MTTLTRKAHAVLRAAAMSDLSYPQLHVLLTLEAGPRRIGDIAEQMVALPSSTTRLTQRLEAMGMVERQTDPDDNRVKMLRLTRYGRRAVDAFLEKV